jgi:hypothetical protein
MADFIAFSYLSLFLRPYWTDVNINESGKNPCIRQTMGLIYIQAMEVRLEEKSSELRSR